MSLLETYERMKAPVAEDQEKLASDRIEVLAKYAELAETLLQEKHANDYDLSDVQELAGYLIEHDNEIEAQEQAKVAELMEAGQILAASFVEEVNNLTEEKK